MLRYVVDFYARFRMKISPEGSRENSSNEESRQTWKVSHGFHHKQREELVSCSNNSIPDVGEEDNAELGTKDPTAKL